MSVWEQLDLDRHAVIDASAGTGKTYALERIVARLLTEREGLTIDQMLIVTFTEKAAGELKDRIRSIIAAKLESADEPARKKLQSALEGFDAASISTIHSFCRRVLQEFAFENRQVMDLEVSDEAGMISTAIADMARREWPDLYGNDLPEYLKAVSPAGDVNSVIDVLSLAAGNFKGGPEDSFDVTPRTKKEWVHYLAAERAKLLTAVRAGSQLRLRDLVGADVEQSPLIQQYSNCGSNPPRREFMKTLWEFLSAPESEVFVRFQDVCQEADKRAKEQGFYYPIYRPVPKNDKENRQNDGKLQEYPITGDLAVHLRPLLAALDALKNERAGFQHHLLIRSTEMIREKLERRKNEEGRLTFDDMIRRVRDALDPGKNPAAQVLLEALRKSYQVAMVDEFQDTDPLQWDIFRRLFVEGAAKHQLIAVGDPKQAIYAFRGADVRTYLAAGRLLTGKAIGGRSYVLNETYRCVPGLVTAFNSLFKGKHWFPETGDGITYTDVSFPSAGNPGVKVGRDSTERSCLVCVQLSNDRDADEQGRLKVNAPVARGRMARFIAAEIKRLVTNPGAFMFQDPKGPPGAMRALRHSDICILVEKKKTARPIEKLLRSAEYNIPYTFYKQPGLYQSDEALHLLCMLEFLANPRDEKAMRKALLSRFMNVSLDCLEAREASLAYDLQGRLDEWLALCGKRQWGSLFDSLLHDTGLWHREAAEPDGERRLSNFRQIFDDLLEAAGGAAFDIAGLLSLLRHRQAGTQSQALESDIHRRESEASKVQIMTMHAAKGLEFPIVFIADGFSDARHVVSRGTHLVFHNDSGSQPGRVFTFDTKNPAKRQRALDEQRDEIKRLYYVALTRAQYKLYLPWLREKPSAWRGITPVSDLILPGVRQADPGIISTVSFEATEPAANARQRKPVEQQAKTLHARPDAGDGVALFALPSVSGRRLFLDSFSSLARHNKTPAPDVSSLLPRGANAGDAFHAIMETFCHPRSAGQPGFERFDELKDFSAMLDDAAIMAIIDNALAQHMIRNRRRLSPEGGLEWETRREAAAMVWRALKVTLAGAGVCLARIPPRDRRAEVEFHFDEKEIMRGDAGEAHRRGVVNGFIDLVIRSNGRYYILDWKTNTLESYEPDAIAKAMSDADYHLQYQIYTLAVRAWLQQALAGFSDGNFGGVFYLFARGGGENPDAPPGVFVEPWQAGSLEAYQEAVRERLHRAHVPDDEGTIAPPITYGGLEEGRQEFGPAADEPDKEDDDTKE